MTNQPQEAPVESCPICHKPAQSWTVCATCVASVDRMLAELLDLHALAHDVDYLLPRTSGNGVGPIGGSRERPIGINVDALDLDMGNDALAILEEWERWWREHWDLAPYGEASAARLIVHVSHGTPELDSTPTSRNLTGTVGFLRARWPTAAQVLEPPPEEFATEVRRLHSRALAALALTRFDIDPDPEAKQPPDYVIVCPTDDCGHRIPMTRQPLPVDGRRPDPVGVNCPKCGAHRTITHFLFLAAATGTKVEISVEDAMSHYGCSRATVYRMVNRGELRRGRYGRVVIGSVEVAG